MKKLYILLTVLIFFMLCEEFGRTTGPDNSSLSGTELTDPSQIKPYIEIKKTVKSDSSVISDVEVWFYDEDYNSIEIMNGSVLINGDSLKLDSTSRGAPYYTGWKIIDSIEINTDYLVEVELSDGSVYTASVHSPDKDLNIFNIPADYSRNNDMDISWEGIGNFDNMQITIFTYGAIDIECYVWVEKNQFYIPTEYICKGYYTIPKEQLAELGITNKIYLSGFKFGTLDDAFQDNGRIKITYEIIKECTFN